MNTLETAPVRAFSHLPLDFCFNYDYSSFGSETLQQQAKQALSQFFGYVRHTFISGLEIGRNFRELLHHLCLDRGLAEGERLFDRWLDSSDFGGSTWMARALIQISEWFDSQRQGIQRLILNSVQSWSVSALKEITKIGNEHLLVKLLKAGKQTVASIRSARKPAIALGQPLTETDWQLIAQTFNVDEDGIDLLKMEVQQLATEANSEPLTDHLIETLRDLTQWDLSIVLAPQKRQNSKSKQSDAAPQQSNRVDELEKQVRDLTAQLKEADKATALIHGLQAERDRLERENLKLQALIQENAQKDLQIHLLEQQLEEFQESQSDSILEQLAAQNEQLAVELERTKQRYEALASEMAANQRSMKYSDNSTLVAKVMSLEAQLAEAQDALVNNKQQKPVDPAQLTVGTYVRIVNHDNRQYCDRIGQILQLPLSDDTLNRYQVRFSGEKYRVTCYPEQMQLVDVFLPPVDDYFTAQQLNEKIAAIAEEKQAKLSELQEELKEAQTAIARYKDPANNPELLRWQQQISEMNARLYDAHRQVQQTTKELNQLKRENQQLKEQLDWESSPLGQMQRK